jgi:hypothetical protein
MCFADFLASHRPFFSAQIFAFVATALQLGAVVAVNAAALQCSLTAMHRSSTPTAMVLINGFTFALGSVGGALLLGERAALTPRALFGAACVAAGLLVLVGSRTGEAAGSSTRTGDATASHGPRARTLSLVVAPVRAPRAAWDGAGVCAALRVGTAVVCVIAMLACQYYIVFAGA